MLTRNSHCTKKLEDNFLCGSLAINEDPEHLLCDRCFWFSKYEKADTAIKNCIGNFNGRAEDGCIRAISAIKFLEDYLENK